LKNSIFAVNKPYNNMTEIKAIGLACDHAGFEMKEHVKALLQARGYECKDFGCYSTVSVDYPDLAHPLALAVESGECYPGIAICGSGNGINMTLNKHQGIRSALCWTDELASLARAHNNANVLVMPGRFIPMETAEKIVDLFLSTPFEGGRHNRRVEKIPM
jgi:ribose 5-phosphate isomerase B